MIFWTSPSTAESVPEQTTQFRRGDRVTVRFGPCSDASATVRRRHGLFVDVVLDELPQHGIYTFPHWEVTLTRMKDERGRMKGRNGKRPAVISSFSLQPSTLMTLLCVLLLLLAALVFYSEVATQPQHTETKKGNR